MLRHAFAAAGLAAAACLLVYSLAFADEEPIEIKTQSFDLAYLGELPEQITVTGRTTGSSPSLQGDVLRSTAPIDTGEALDMTPGISMVRRGAIANDTMLRGFSRDRLNVVIDGQKAFGAGPNRMDPPLFQVDPDEIELVRLIKGPYDVRHPGSLGGLIYVQTRVPDPGLHAKFGLGFASFAHEEARARVSYGGEKLSALVGASARQADPYRSGDGTRITDIYAPTDPNRYLPSAQDDKAFQTHNLWSRVIATPAEGHEFTLSVGQQKATDVIYPYLTMDASLDKSVRFASSYSIHFEKTRIESVQFDAYYDDVDHDMDNDLRANPTEMETNAKASTGGGALHSELEALGGTLTLGVDFIQREWDVSNTMEMQAMPPMMAMTWKQNMIPDTSHQDYGAFLDFEREFTPELELHSGLRADYARTKAREAPYGAGMATIDYADYWPGSDRRQQQTALSGNVQLDWNLSQESKLYVGVGRGVRMPDALELFVARAVMSGNNWVGNPNLEPEKNHEVDLGFDYSAKRFELRTSIFAAFVKDYIAQIEKPAVTASGEVANTYLNTDAELYGAEIETLFRLNSMVSFYADAEYVRGRQDKQAPFITDSDMAEVPPLHGHVGIHFDFNWFYADLEGEFATEQDRVDSDLNESHTAGWGIATLRAGGTYKKMRFDAAVRNLFDKQYDRHLSYLRNPFSSGVRLPEPGRRYSITASVSF